MPTIKFTDTTGMVPEEYYPVPAKAHIPEWLKKLAPYGADKSLKLYNGGGFNQTAKRCVPMVDAVMLGYTIVLTEDISVEEGPGVPLYRWPEGLGLGFHPRSQVESEPSGKPPIPKWNNPFGITTPKGYSTLFVPPIMANPVFNIFSGVVDTDTYHVPVRLPFELSQPDWAGIVPAGTPIAQVIPFRRETWKLEVEKSPDPENEKQRRKVKSVFKDGYRNMFWQRKSYS